MDLSRQLAMLPQSLQSRPGMKKALAAIAFAAALSGIQLYNGLVSKTLRSIRRAFAAALSEFLEAQSGLSLLTPEGTLPLQRPAPKSSTLAWETLTAGDQERRPGHAFTDVTVTDTPGHGGPTRKPRPTAGSFDSSDADGTSGSSESPNFFASTKFFACLDLKESQQLYESSQLVALDPHETLFESGDSSAPGIFIVVEGQLGVFNPDLHGGPARHTNTLHPGESVGDLDVLDGAARTLTCMALGEGALLVQISQRLFLDFIAAKPRTLQIYLQKAMARLWRVAHFVLTDFLDMALPASAASGHAVGRGLPPHQQYQQQRSPHSQDYSAQPGYGMGPCGQDSGMASPFSRVPENVVRPAGLPVEQARRTLRAVQDPQPGIPQAAQAALERAEAPVVGSPGQQLDGREMAVKDAVQDQPPEVQQEVGVAAMTAAAIAGGQAAAAAAAIRPAVAALKALNAVTSSTVGGNGSGPMLPQPSADTEASAPALDLDSAAQPGEDGAVPATASGPLALSTVGSLASAESLASVAGRQPPPPPPEELVQAQQNAQRGLAAQQLHQLQLDALAAASGSAFAAPEQQQRRPPPPPRGRTYGHSAPMAVPAGRGGGSSGASSQSPSWREEARQHRSHSASRRALDLSHMTEASLSGGWDIVADRESHLPPKFGVEMAQQGLGQPLRLSAGRALHKHDRACRRFYMLLEGDMLAERPAPQRAQSEGAVGAGALLSAAAFLSGTRTSATLRAASPTCHLLAFGAPELQQLLVAAPQRFVALLLAAGQSLAPLIRRFVSLGLNRVWLHSGDAIYRQGDPAASMYIVISGRARLLRREGPPRNSVTVEDEVARGEAVGGVYMLSGGAYDTTALCIRDSELVRMSKGSFEMLAQQSPTSVATIIESMARRISAAAASRTGQAQQFDRAGKLVAEAVVPQKPTQLAARGGGGRSQGRRRGDIVTIALVPAGVVPGAGGQRGGSVSESACSRSGAAPSPTPSAATQQLGIALRDTLSALFGPTLHLTSSGVEAMFPTAFERMGTGFYRSKITSWMAAQEEDYRFILLEADADVTPWSRICVSQADCTLLVAAPSALPHMGAVERELLWAKDIIPRSGALSTSLGDSNAADWVAEFRRVELVRLHASDCEPMHTAAWLGPRPQLHRHHHVRLANDKDLARLSRWMAGKAVGLVLSGGGSRGLAHLGVLHALDTAGIPIDVVGGTSQGAFMAALYAQGLAWGDMHKAVRKYAARMSSVRHLLQDLTLPLISLFTGRGFDAVLRETFANGPQNIEDLWLNYFCVTTNLSRGEAAVHSDGLLWKLVRASMTIVGLVPPVFEQGDLLIDGGYLNNIPVDVMHQKGVDKVIVVDVEDRDDSAWQDLTPIGEHGVSGWRLLWDRWMPIKRLRFGLKLPRYNQIVNALTWMSHSQALKRMSKDYVIDLYMRPPVWHFRLMDYHLMNVIVRDSNRYAWEVISEWQSRVGGDLGTVLAAGPAVPRATGGGTRRGMRANPSTSSMRRYNSISCMTQLQAKQGAASDDDSRSGMPLLRRKSLTLTAPQPRSWTLAESAASMPPGAEWMAGGASPTGRSTPSGASSPVGSGTSPLGTSPDLHEFWGSYEGQQRRHAHGALHSGSPFAAHHPPAEEGPPLQQGLTLPQPLQQGPILQQPLQRTVAHEEVHVPPPRQPPMLRQVTLNAADMRRLASGKLPGGGARMVSADMGALLFFLITLWTLLM